MNNTECKPKIEMSGFSKQKILRDSKQQKQFLPYLRNLGFKPWVYSWIESYSDSFYIKLPRKGLIGLFVILYYLKIRWQKLELLPFTKTTMDITMVRLVVLVIVLYKKSYCSTQFSSNWNLDSPHPRFSRAKITPQFLQINLGQFLIIFVRIYLRQTRYGSYFAAIRNTSIFIW